MAKEPNLYLLSDKAQAILNFIRTETAEYTTNEISDKLGDGVVTHRGAVAVANSLVKRGLAERQERTDEDGKLIKVLVPTEEGRKFDLKTVNPRHEIWAQKEAEKKAKADAKAEADDDPDINF